MLIACGNQTKPSESEYRSWENSVPILVKVLHRAGLDALTLVLEYQPPIGSLIDAAVAAKQCDGAVLVIESETVSRRVAAKAKEQLEMSGCRILGAVLNKVDIKNNKYYQKYSYYYYNGEK